MTMLRPADTSHEPASANARFTALSIAFAADVASPMAPRTALASPWTMLRPAVVSHPMAPANTLRTPDAIALAAATAAPSAPRIAATSARIALVTIETTKLNAVVMAFRIVVRAFDTALVMECQWVMMSASAIPNGPARIPTSSGQFALNQSNTDWAADLIAFHTVPASAAIVSQFLYRRTPIAMSAAIPTTMAATIPIVGSIAASSPSCATVDAIVATFKTPSATAHAISPAFITSTLFTKGRTLWTSDSNEP